MLKAFLTLGLLLSFLTPSLALERQSSSSVDPQTGISLPKYLGPLTRVRSKKYDLRELGIDYRYEVGPLIKADIFIYDLGKKNLGTGINSPEMRPHFRQVKNDIFAFEKRGHYQSVKKISEGKTTLKSSPLDIPALSAVFTYSQALRGGVVYEGMRVSHLLLTAYKGYFIKIRFSYPLKQQKQGKRAWQQFLADFGKNLK